MANPHLNGAETPRMEEGGSGGCVIFSGDEFESRIAAAIEHSHRHALAVVDLASIDQVRDVHGPLLALRCNEHALQLVRSSVRDSDIVWDLDNEQIAVLLFFDGMVGDRPAAVASRLIDGLSQPLVLNDGLSVALQIHIGVGIGVPGTSAADLVKRAQFAVREAAELRRPVILRRTDAERMVQQAPTQ